MEYDLVAIGDVVTDAFIRLKDASVHCDINKEHCMISMRFGDKIPYEDVYIIPAVGNSSNAAVSASRLGLRTAFITNIGSDYYGKECLDALIGEHVAPDFVKVNEGHKTNYHYVLWFEDDRTILVKHEEYEYSLPDIGDPGWIYLSSLGENSLSFHKEIEKYLLAYPGIKLAFQPGTYQMKFGAEALRGIYQRSEVFFCNKEEAQRILATGEHEIKNLLSMMHNLGPKLVVITDGKKGAYMHTPGASTGEFWFMPPYPDPKPPYERTGAGDAFSSTFTAALALGMKPEEALKWGPINSMSVVQYVGAREGLLSRQAIEAYLGQAPADYHPVRI